MSTETKRYYIDFYDMIDGWGDFGFFLERLFDDLDLAIKTCDKLNSELDKTNKDCGEHYGVIDGTINQEVYCGMDEKYRTNILKTIGMMSKVLGTDINMQEKNKDKKLDDIDWNSLEDYWTKGYEEDYIPKK